jgi:hypothetical protein
VAHHDRDSSTRRLFFVRAAATAALVLAGGTSYAETATVAVLVEFADRIEISEPAAEALQSEESSAFTQASAADADSLTIDIDATPGRLLSIFVSSDATGDGATCRYEGIVADCGTDALTGVSAGATTLEVATAGVDGTGSEHAPSDVEILIVNH